MDGGPLKPVPGSVWRLASTGVELAGAVAGGCLLGYWVDWHFGTGRWGLIIGASLGIIGGLYNMIRKAVLESLTMSSKKPPGPIRGPTRKGESPGDRPPEGGSP
jgi:hypothetical protein